jgi:hypothetical protein
MPELATTKINIPSKVHYTEYIITENVPKEPPAGISQHLKGFDEGEVPIASHRYAVFKRALVRIFHV